MTTDSRLRTLVSEGRGVPETPIERPSVSVEEMAVPTAPALHFDPNSGFNQLQVGELIAGRFQVQLLAQVGGMGSIYRAQDLLDGKLVAIKTLRRGAASPERFEKEASRLATLSHPGIPAYVASGMTSTGEPYLAMEWLEGIDLANYVRQRRLGIQTSVGLVRGAADAVASAHARGIVHRDLNPSNLFLVNQSPENVRVLDFGVARLTSDARPVTERGARVGTPGYMAPEQVEGRDVTPETDVFALGCVLYELLTGQRAFAAPTVAEVLSRIVRDTPEAPSAYNASIPPELDEVVLSCLDKDPKRRPENAAELVSLLGALQDLVDLPMGGGAAPSVRSHGEQHISAMIVLKDEPAGTYQRASQAAAPHGLRAQCSPDGTIVLVAAGPGTATDHATRAARCALAVQKATRTPQMALSTGLALIDGPSPSGRAFDSAVVSLLLNERDENSARGSTIWLDDNTATLLDSRFEVRRVDRGFILTALRETYEPARTVLGRKTRCVGRKRELSMLEATLNECIEERMASAVLITGAPGIGKSRLAYELSRRARRATQPVEILRGGADPMSAGSPFSMLIQAIHRACEIRETESESTRRRKLTDRLAKVVAPDDMLRISEFLGELIGTPALGDESAQLQAARRDSMLRGDQILRAFEDWLRAECAKQPVLLILDDFHWGDLPTVKFIDSVLRNLSELPFMVVALARPEVHDFFPKLWAQRGVTELRLSGLSRRAALEMIQEVLGDDIDGAVVERVITRAQGNPFWIEELLRAEDAGQGENVPDRVLLLAQSRIEQLNIDARRLLRSGSVFGRRFWLGGVRALLGNEALGRSIEAVVAEMVEGEFLVERELARMPGDRQFEFANGLLRDAAYSSLPEEEREIAHLLAAQWLEKSGESEPLPIALHYTLGGESDRARPHYLKAAEQSLAGNDLDGALSCVEEGLAAGASGLDAVALRLVQAEACRWRGDNQAALRWARAALEQAGGGKPFYRAVAEAAVAAGKIGDVTACADLAQRLLESKSIEESEGERSIALCRAATQLILAGQTDLGRKLLEEASRPNSRVHPDPARLGYLLEAQAILAGATDDPVGRIEYAGRAAEFFDDAGDRRNACAQRISLGFAQVEFGANEEALVSLREALRVAERMDLANSIPIAQAQLGRALARQGSPDEALQLLTEAAGLFDRHKNVRLAGMSRTYLAELQIAVGHVDLGLDAARRAVALLEPYAAMQRVARATLSLVLLEAQEPQEALREARLAFGDLGESQHLAVGEDLVRLALVEALRANGESAEAEAEQRQAAARVERLTQGLTETRRRQFLCGAPARKRLLTLEANEPTSTRRSYAQILNDGGIVALDENEQDSLEVVLADLQRVDATTEPVLRNLWITQRYHRLGLAIGRYVDKGHANWSTFACWASLTAGQSIRSEEVPRLVRKELGLDEKSLGRVQGGIGRLLESTRLGRVVRAAAVDTMREVSEQIAVGNREVFSELSPLFARFVDLMGHDPGDAMVESFTATLQPGAAELGGQDSLRLAFRAWYTASRSDNPKERAQLVYYANCLIGLHEQTRLQPHIMGAMNAPIEVLFKKHLSLRIPGPLGKPLAALLSMILGRFKARLTEIWQRLATRYAMNLSLPDGQEIPLGRDLPNRPDVYPVNLRELQLPELVALLKRYEPRLQGTRGTGAHDWADLTDRMGFIVALFRSRQDDSALLGPPFGPAQEKLLAEGRVPADLS